MCRTFEIFILACSERPEEGKEPEKSESDRNRDQDHKYRHRASLAALSDTVTDDADIASAASSGVARPASATGMAMRL